MRCHRPVILQFRQDALGQLLAQFHPPLVKTEYVPDDALDKDLVLVHGDEAAQDPGRQHLKKDRGRGPVAFKDAVPPVHVNIVSALAGLGKFRHHVFFRLPQHQGLGLGKEVESEVVALY